jgi:hypothetical protein
MSGLEALKVIGELKENGVKINTTEEFEELKEYISELIEEQHRLFDLCKEQEKALKIICGKIIAITSDDFFDETIGFRTNKVLEEGEFEIIKRAVQDYGEK